MNCLKIFLIITIVFALKTGHPLNAQDFPTQEQVLEKMTLANDYFVNKWPDPTIDIVTDRARPSNIWTRSTYYEGLMALYEIDPEESYYNYAVQWGEGHNWEPAYGGTWTTNADNQCCGQTYLELYQIDPQSERLEKIKTTIDRMVNNDTKDYWWWIDALQMAMPVFAKLGAITEDSSYFEKMYDIYYYTKIQHGDNGLYNPEDHLWWRDENFDPPYTAPNGEDTYWSRGNGWVFAALSRVLDVMPENVPHREEYVTTFQDMAEALILVQREDGFWNVSLHDPNDFGGKETSGTAFFTFGLAWGVNNGLLTDEKFTTAAVKAWNAMVNDALHPDGFLGYVQSTGKQPSDGQPVTYDSVPNFEDYGLGAFLLAGSEIYKLPDAVSHVKEDNESFLPEATILRVAYPNPFNLSTNITFNLNKPSSVTLSIYDIMGSEIFSFFNGAPLGAGEFKVTWHGQNKTGQQVSSGMYVIRLETGTSVKTRKVILQK